MNEQNVQAQEEITLFKEIKAAEGKSAEIVVEEFTMSTREAAEFLKVTPQSLRTWRSRRINLPFLKIGGTSRYRKKDLEEFIKSGMNGI